MASDQQDYSVHRRDVLCGGGAAAFATMVAALLGGAKPLQAQPISGSVPEVDRVAVRVVVDSYQIAVAPGMKAGNVDVQRFGWGIGAEPPRKTLLSEFGLSMFAESQRGAETRNILMDFGFTPETLINNIELLGIDPAAIDAMVLSHGHYDHFGGLVGFLQQHGIKLKRGLPLYIGGEECFCAREWTGPPVRGNFGALDRKALENADVAVTYAEQPSRIGDHAFTSGQIGLTSFERLLSPSAMKIGVEQGIGCFPEKFTEEERAKAIIPDQFRHEIATAFNLKGRGLVVLTSCSHRGVVNAIRQAQAASGIRRVHAVIGGFHLAPHNEGYLRETVAALKDLNPDYVIPLHCTGEPFYDIAKSEMPGKLLRSYTGTRFVFDA
jgi:7,8-dihydropterin-6-yl-methyl-4-(beta-D-ribofuranosyl)aminobenzene 5'-phosphate synthase